MEENKLEDGFIMHEGDIYVSLTMLENFANGMLDSMKTPHFLAASVKTMCEEMYVKAGLREEDEGDGNPSNA